MDSMKVSYQFHIVVHQLHTLTKDLFPKPLCLLMPPMRLESKDAYIAFPTSVHVISVLKLFPDESSDFIGSWRRNWFT
jgi:hypothetical protein